MTTETTVSVPQAAFLKQAALLQLTEGSALGLRKGLQLHLEPTFNALKKIEVDSIGYTATIDDEFSTNDKILLQAVFDILGGGLGVSSTNDSKLQIARRVSSNVSFNWVRTLSLHPFLDLILEDYAKALEMIKAQVAALAYTVEKEPSKTPVLEMKEFDFKAMPVETVKQLLNLMGLGIFVSILKETDDSLTFTLDRFNIAETESSNI